MYFDIAMPLTLLAVVAISVLMSGKVEKRLKAVFEEREFKTKDAIILVAAITVTVSVVTFIPLLAVVTLFLFAFSLLLFIFAYIFSDCRKAVAKLCSMAFFVASFLIATLSFFMLFPLYIYVAYGALALYCLCGFSMVALFYEETRQHVRERWYLAAMPSVLFVILYVFFNRTPIWFPYLLDTYSLIFAVLITLYLGGLFTWKTSLVFTGLLTIADTVLVLVTGAMVSAATNLSDLGLPVFVILPTIPRVATNKGTLLVSLGLGDFFFSGLLAIQTYKKFGKSVAFLSTATMAFSFFMFEMFMFNFGVTAFPGTLMIISGWVPIVLLKYVMDKKSRNRVISLLT